jgi:hypothetical protein
VVADVRQAYYAVLQTEGALEAMQFTVKQYQETDRVVLNYVAQRSVLKSYSLEVKAKLAQYQVAQRPEIRKPKLMCAARTTIASWLSRNTFRPLEQPSTI